MSEEASTMIGRRTENLQIDKGWAWVVLLACFCQLFLYVGTQRSFGLLFVAFLETYDTNASMVSLLISLQTGVTSFISFFVMILGHKYVTSRQLIIVGGFFTAFGYFLDSFALDVYFLIFSHSIIHASGCAAVYGPALVSLNSYFDKRKGLANSLASVGGSTGSLIIPLLLRYLLDNYGLQGSLMIMSGLLLNMITAGVLMKPVRLSKAFYKHKHRIEKMKNGSVVNDPMIDTDVAGLADENNSTIFAQLNRDLSTESTVSSHKQNVSSLSSNTVINDVSGIKSSLIGSPENMASSVTAVNTSNSWTSSGQNCCMDLFLVDVIKNHRFQLIMVIGFFCVFGSLLTVSFIPPFAKDHDIPNDQIALLITIIAVCDLIGRFSVAWIADSRIIKRYHLVGMCMGICGTASVLNFLYTDFPSFVAYAVVFGLVAGVYFALYPLLIVEAVGPENLTNGLAIMFPVHGVSLMINSFLLGYLRDTTGSYHWSFILIGSGLLIGAVCLFCEPIATKLEKRRLRTMQNCWT